ncbi:importin-4-like [Orbicella faveolata]|uniref:importin-4-like n=1 Tax=Orbicella faveolata TaxID=48498 RepID=UPI0009E1D2E6|nr:importin-4-like [Orbicella faveolata]
MGMFLLSSITESANEQLRPHFTSLFQLFSSTLEDQQSKLVPFYTIRALTCLIECVGTDEIPLVRPLIPKVVAFINQILSIDEDKACDAMEIFDELVESEVSIVTPHLKALVEFCLQIASNSSCGDNLRIKALYFVSWLARIKPKALVKNKLLLPTLSVVFPLMASPPSEDDDFDDEDEDDEVEEGTEASRPCAVASQVKCNVKLNLDRTSTKHDCLISCFQSYLQMQFVQPALGSEDPYKRKAALIALAVLAEGCADYIRNRLVSLGQFSLDSSQKHVKMSTHYASEDDPSFLLEDQDLGEEDDDDEVTGYSVENAYLEEKEDTCNALGEISENSGTEFLPYLDESFKEVLKLIQFPHTGVRKGAVMALGQFCSGFHSLLEEAGAEDKTALQRMLGTAIPTFITVITKDKDRSVAMATLQSLNEVLKAVKSLIVDEQGHPDAIANAARSVLMQKTACQQGDDDDIDDSDQQAEFDAMLIEYAGDILPSLATAVGGQIFAPYFAGFLPLLLKKTRKSCSVSDKSFAIGTISEVLLAMAHAIVPFVQHLFPVFMTSLKDEDDEVRSNAIYGLGLLAFYGGDLITPHYQTILEALFVILSQNQPPRVVDNICGAVSRMVMANRNSLPLEKVFPGLLQCLPLKEDFEENHPVYSCIMELFSDQHPLIRQYLPQLLAVFSQVLPSGSLQDGIRSGVVSMIQKIHQQSPQRFQNILAEMPQEHAQVLMAAATAQAPG